MSTKRFLGYDTDENGKLVINREQAEIVERIYDEYLSDKTVDHTKVFETGRILIRFMDGTKMECNGE